MSPVGRSTAQVAGRVGDLFGPFRSDPAQQESALSPQALGGTQVLNPIGSAFRELTAGLIGKAQRMHDARPIHRGRDRHLLRRHPDIIYRQVAGVVNPAGTTRSPGSGVRR